MIIACLGCSYTAGMPEENYYSWPERLSSLRPNDTVYNIALGGSSLLFEIFILEELHKICNIDKVVFQITHPHRYTFFNNLNLKDKLIKKENYIRLDPEVRRKEVMTITPADTSFRWTKSIEKVKFAKEFYKKYNTAQGELNYKLLKSHVTSISNISFTYDQLPENIKVNTLNDNRHFNQTGHDLIAQWIDDELERNVH